MKPQILSQVMYFLYQDANLLSPEPPNAVQTGEIGTKYSNTRPYVEHFSFKQLYVAYKFSLFLK